MDFHTLSRKELQALCKKNKIPANITNVAMADSLAALEQVEGLDEILNGEIGTPDIRPRTASRTSTQRKTRIEPGSSKVTSRVRPAVTAGTDEGVVEQENKDDNIPATPAPMPPSSRRRAPAPSTRRTTKKEAEVQEEVEDNGEFKAPIPVPSSRTRGRSVRTKSETSDGASVQQAYSTRRSVRLMGKSLSKMSLMDTEDEGLTNVGDVSEELSGISEGSSVTGKGASFQTGSSLVSSENSDVLEVSSLNNTDYECQSQEVVSEKVNDLEPELQAEKQEEVSENVNDMVSELQSEKKEEASENITVAELQAEKQEEVSENVNDMVSELQSEKKEEASENITVAELQAEKQEEVSENVHVMVAELQAEKQDEVSENANDMDSTEEGPKMVSELEESCETEDALSVEVSKEAFMEVPDQDTAPLTAVEPVDSCVDDGHVVAGSLLVSSVNDASVSLKEFVESNTDNEGSNEHDDAGKEESNETEDTIVAEMDTSSDVTGASSEAVIEVFNESVADEKASIESSAEMEFDVTEKDASSENSEAVTVVCNESFADEKANVEAVLAEKDASFADDKESLGIENVILQLSSLDVADSSDKLAANVMKGTPLEKKSMRQLKKIMKKQFAGPQEYNDKPNVVQEGKRTALQALPQNLQ